MQPSPSMNRLWLTHWAVIVAGGLVGLLAAAYLNTLPFDFSHELEEARRLGIVSLTILNNYPKSLDLLLYGLLILVPVSCSMTGWLIWSLSRRQALTLLFSDQDSGGPARSLPLGMAFWAVLLIGLLATFNINGFYSPISDWALLGETGEHLAWADIINNGGTYARDFFCLYGPLWTYPLAWTMKLFAPSILVYRIFAYSLDLLGHAIVVLFLYRTLRLRGLFVIAALYSFLISTNLRFALGFVPLLILFRHADSNRSWPRLASGVTIGLSLLYSQEAGFCSAIASAVFLCLEDRPGHSFRRLARNGTLLTAGTLLAVLPVLFFFYQQDALGRFFESLYGYPKLVTLGYAALPFPSLNEFLNHPLANGVYFPYWIIAIYLCSALALLPDLFLGRHNRTLHLRLAVMAFGLILFRAALGRSDNSHFINSSLPAFLLSFLLLDDLITAAINRHSPWVRKAGRIMVATALIASQVLVITNFDRFRISVLGILSGLRHPAARFTLQTMGSTLPQLPRLGIQLDQQTTNTLLQIKEALARRTDDGEYVLFFPNEAAYYFLFNRHCPTRYVLSYLAVTSSQRQEMITDLELKRPAYVVYSLDNWRIDDIPEQIQVPEVLNYLKEHYLIDQDMGNFLILKRNEG